MTKTFHNNEVVSFVGTPANLKTFKFPTNMNNFDSFIISTITYQPTVLPPNFSCTYYLYCNYTNSFIVSFSTSFYQLSATNYVSPASTTPNLEVKIDNPINSSLGFSLWVYDLTQMSLVEVPLNENGMIGIHLSFVKY